MNYIEFTGEYDLLKSESPKSPKLSTLQTLQTQMLHGDWTSYSTVPEIYPEKKPSI